MQRHVVPEWMDAPDLDPAEHRRALAGLRRINALSRAAQSMCRPIRRFIAERKLKRVRMLDVASGGGEVPIDIARSLHSGGIGVDLTLFDRSDVGFADVRAKASGLTLRTQIGDVLDALPAQAYDVVTCSLFLHHLSGEQCVAALAQMKAAAAGIIVVSDLRRSGLGLFAATVGSHLLSRSPTVHHDGPASVRAAWTPEELHDLARHAGLGGIEIRRCFPWRMLVVARS